MIKLRSGRLRRIAVGAAFLLASVFGDALALELFVKVRSPTGPDGVSIERDGGADPKPLQWDMARKGFRASFSDPAPIALPYTLVADWGQQKELLYLSLSSRTAADVNLQVIHEPVDPSLKGLDKIDALPPDFQSMLARYFGARAFHRHLRYEFKKPRHQQAIRSAHIWFHAAADLAKRREAHIRMDTEIRKIMEDYEELAKTDSAFRDVFRSIVRAGNISGTLDQVAAAQYSFVGDVAALVGAGDYQQAAAVNKAAIVALKGEDSQTRRIVEKLQGVTLDQLTRNVPYIRAKLDASKE